MRSRARESPNWRKKKKKTSPQQMKLGTNSIFQLPMTGYGTMERKRKRGVQPRTEKFSRRRIEEKKNRKKPHGSSRIRYGPHPRSFSSFDSHKSSTNWTDSLVRHPYSPQHPRSHSHSTTRGREPRLSYFNRRNSGRAPTVPTLSISSHSLIVTYGGGDIVALGE